MMSLHTIRCVNQEIAARAAQEDLVPFRLFSDEELESYPPFPFPNLGHFQPDGWEKTENSWFVDKTEHGYNSEPALSVEQFKRELRRYITENPGHGFAIIEEGECQAVVSAFIPVE